jgi:hypothetical protein
MTTEQPWSWPEAMDALLAAPVSHRVLLENDRVRVLEVVIEPGTREPEQRHRRLAKVTPGDDHAAGDGVLLPGLGHPGPDLVLERVVVSHAMSLAATLARALIAWLSGD